jgi:hypothetical protein
MDGINYQLEGTIRVLMRHCGRRIPHAAPAASSFGLWGQEHFSGRSCHIFYAYFLTLVLGDG